MGHQVTVRINRSASHRYRLDGGRELTAQARRQRLAGETVGGKRPTERGTTDCHEK